MAASPRIAVRLKPDLHARLRAAAEAENRSVSNMVQHLLAQMLPDDGSWPGSDSYHGGEQPELFAEAS